MKKILASVVIASMLLISGCTKVPAGNVGVKVYLLGGEKGVESEVLGVGKYWIGWNEDLYLFPTFTQNYVWTANSIEGSEENESIGFQTSEGLSVSADVGISYRIDPEKVSTVFQKYRKGVDEITDLYLRNMVRDSLNKRASELPVEAVYGRGKAALIEQVQLDVQQQVVEIGIIVEKIYWIGEIRLPKVVLAALNAKIGATQKAQQRENEVAQAIAEADKKIEDARGEAESLKLKNVQVTDKILKLKELENQALMIERWDGKLPTVSAGESGMILNLGK